MTFEGRIREVLGHKGKSVWTISPEETVFAAIKMMAEKNVGALLVTKNDKLVGIIGIEVDCGPQRADCGIPWGSGSTRLRLFRLRRR